jgi:hypothetical protein
MKHLVAFLGFCRTLRCVLSLLTIAATIGCQVSMPGKPRIAGSPATPPDYNMPEAQFAHADFNKLGSEFLDEYAGQYVTFEGRYLNHAQGSIIYARSGPPQTVTDLMSAMIGAPGSGGQVASPRYVTVHWSVEDRELGRPFLDPSSGAPVRIYGYVLPANTMAQIKSRRDHFLRGFPAPVVLLIKAEPFGSK